MPGHADAVGVDAACEQAVRCAVEPQQLVDDERDVSRLIEDAADARAAGRVDAALREARGGDNVAMARELCRVLH